MKRLIYLLTLISFSLAYMEWGGDNHGYVFDIQKKVFTEPDHFISNITHPVILAGFVGQIILLIAIFKPKIRFIFVIIAIGLLGVPIILILMSGLFSSNARIVGSCLPFLGLALWVLLKTKSKDSRIGSGLNET